MKTSFKNIASILPKWTLGVLLSMAIAFIAKFLGDIFPIIGGILFAILIGIIIKNTMGVFPAAEHGLNFTIKKLLKLSVILLGASLNIAQILVIGKQSFSVIIVSVLLGIVLTTWFGRLLKLDKRLSLMIGVGTSICGATAISCVKGVLDSKDDETAYAISTIVLFNLIAFFVYPVVGHFFHFHSTAFGIWAGTAVHDTSSAVAVGYLYDDKAGQIATTVKLARTLFLLPVILILPFLMKTKGSTKNSLKKAFPWFVVWFVLVSILNTLGFIPQSLTVLFTSIAKFIIIIVMAAVGLQVNISQFSRLGIKPLLTGMFASVLISLVSLAMIMLMF